MNECGCRAKGTFLFVCGILLGVFWGAGAVAQTVATPTIASDSTLIPPSGLVVTLKCDTGAAKVHYTTDGSDPTETDPYVTIEDPPGAAGQQVTVQQLTGLTANQTVEFRAKAFKDGLTASAVASADFISFADPEFHTQFAVSGIDTTLLDSPDTLVFGFKTGAADGLDALDNSSDPNPPTPPPGVPPPPISVALFTTDPNIQGGGNFLSVDYRTRQDREEFRLQVQLYEGEVGPPSITLTWDGVAGATSDLSQVPYLHLVRKMNPDNLEENTDVADLLQPGTVTISAANFPNLGTEDDANNRIFYVVYRNENTLQVNIGPANIPAEAKWHYRPATGGAYSDWLGSGASSPAMHPGDYEIEFATPVTGYFRPPNQIVTLEPGQTPTVVNVDYLQAATQATMTVEPLYDPDLGTVDINCTFTYTPDVSLTQVVWTFNLTADWTITSVSGLPAGWTADIQGDGVTVVFTYSGSRGTPNGSYFSFVARSTFGGVTPGELEIVVNDISSTPSGGGSLATTPPPSQTANPRTATLDVNGDGTYDAEDLTLIYWKWYGYDPAIAAGAPTIVALAAISSDATVAQAVVDAVEEMQADLDMDQDTDTDDQDIVLIYWKWYGYDPAIAAGAPSVVALAAISADAAVAQHVVDQVDSLTPAIP